MHPEKGSFQRDFARAQAFVEQGLEDLCGHPDENIPPRLAEAMAYSLTAGGKRLRPVLCLKTAEIFGLPSESCLPLALGLEMIHTASLIHDDLPAMDDDVLRRGKPTSHVRYGECLAILAGDALMAYAFEYPLSRLPGLGLPPARVCEAILLLANALGPSGICGGQVLDTDDGSMDESPDFPWKVARQKTGVLLQASVVSGAVLAGADNKSRRALEDFGEHLGNAFQVTDDILDVTSTAEELGKTPGKDASQDKRTFVAVFGLEEAKRLAAEENRRAEDALRDVAGDVSFLVGMSRFLTGRNR